ncbi:MAG TPA: peptide ABC transporter substrate-binding protein [Roseiflexaceae bacterium]|nr:peptide ABC transporter substrate-binding protein [Roseiflexaceae bacterium]
MTTASLPPRAARLASALLGFALLLAACTIEGGVPQATSTATPQPGPPPTSAAVAEQIAARQDTWAIGLTEAPPDLYPYPQGAAAARAAAPVIELLFPSPILAHSYTYTATGVLERIPTLENGDAEIRKADVYLDVAGNITTTVTQLITQVDQLVVTFRWNPKLTWSDGTPVTADDSVFAYELARAAPAGPEARDLLAQTASYEKVDDHTTRAVLRPDFTGPTYFLSYWTPLPRHLLAGVAPHQAREAFMKSPVGYGPYAVERRAPGEIHMVRNEHYFGPPPAARRLVFRVMPDMELLRANILNGNLDVFAADKVTPELFEALAQDTQEGAQVTYLPGPIYEHIDFNLDVELLQDIRVRRAIAYGTDRQGMAEALFGGRSPVLDSWVLPGQEAAAPPDQITRYPHSPDEARRLLDEAGYTDPDGDGVRVSQDGVTLTLQLLTTEGSPIRQAIAERLREDMRAIGVQLEVETTSSEGLFSPDGPLYLRQFELVLYGSIARPEPAGLQLWSCAAVPSDANNWAGDNFAGWCFREADQAVRIAATSLDAAERQAAYLRQQQLWTQELPSLPLFQRLSLAVVAPDVVGVRPDALAPITWNVSEWRRTK